VECISSGRDYPRTSRQIACYLPEAATLRSSSCTRGRGSLRGEALDRLASQGCTIAITGSEEERGLAARLQSLMQAPALDLAGKTELGGVAALIAAAALVVCNDTGISHVAAALGTPSVVVCCGADPGRWAPLDASRHAVLYQPLDCRPCLHAVCPIGHRCALAVDPPAVFERCTDMLARYAGHDRLAQEVQ